MIYRCDVPVCTKTVLIFSYKDGVGFLLGEHTNTIAGGTYEFLDCAGNLLSKFDRENLWDGPTIDYEVQKEILELYISLNIKH